MSSAFPRSACATCGRSVCWTAVVGPDGPRLRRIDAAPPPSDRQPDVDVIVYAGTSGPIAYDATHPNPPALPVVARTRLHYATCSRPGRVARLEALR